MTKALIISNLDNVATALSPMERGQEVEMEWGEELLTVTVVEAIPAFYKFALKDFKYGDKVVKYGEVIGEASAAIGRGQLVHIHNIRSGRGGGNDV